MRLWLIKTTRDVDWDSNQGFVVRAETARAARQVAADAAVREGSKHWLDPKESTCTALKLAGKPGIILKDFVAG